MGKLNRKGKEWKYIVWVGGTDDYYVHFEDAQRAYDEWIDKGYDDVIIEKIKGESYGKTN